MAGGTPLTDEDRKPWLAALAQQLARSEQSGSAVVLACSALKPKYRRAHAQQLQQPQAIRLPMTGYTRPTCTDIYYVVVEEDSAKSTSFV